MKPSKSYFNRYAYFFIVEQTGIQLHAFYQFKNLMFENKVSKVLVFGICNPCCTQVTMLTKVFTKRENIRYTRDTDEDWDLVIEDKGLG
jgi:hypothetical protein